MEEPAVAHERVVVLVRDETHLRHPMWNRLTVCGLRHKETVRNRRIACKQCRKTIPFDELLVLDEQAALLPHRERPTRQSFRAAEPAFVDVDLECVCGNRQTESLPGDSPMRASLAKAVCRSCARVGLHTAPVLEHPPSIDPDDVA